MYNFLAVCGFGVGSSMVLKMTIEKVCKQKGIDCKVENTDISTAKGSNNVDAVFTSKELGDELIKSLDAPVYPIKRYMSQDEVGEAIEEFLKSKE